MRVFNTLCDEFPKKTLLDSVCIARLIPKRVGNKHVSTPTCDSNENNISQQSLDLHSSAEVLFVNILGFQITSTERLWQVELIDGSRGTLRMSEFPLWFYSVTAQQILSSAENLNSKPAATKLPKRVVPTDSEESESQIAKEARELMETYGKYLAKKVPPHLDPSAPFCGRWWEVTCTEPAIKEAEDSKNNSKDLLFRLWTK